MTVLHRAVSALVKLAFFIVGFALGCGLIATAVGTYLTSPSLLVAGIVTSAVGMFGLLVLHGLND